MTIEQWERKVEWHWAGLRAQWARERLARQAKARLDRFRKVQARLRAKSRVRGG